MNQISFSTPMPRLIFNMGIKELQNRSPAQVSFMRVPNIRYIVHNDHVAVEANTTYGGNCLSPMTEHFEQNES